jgi:hypothetical protein
VFVAGRRAVSQKSLSIWALESGQVVSRSRRWFRNLARIDWRRAEVAGIVAKTWNQAISFGLAPVTSGFGAVSSADHQPRDRCRYATGVVTS